MNTKRQTKKTTPKRATRRTAPKRRITFTVDGERYADLERVANAMNRVSWCDNDNTPESVFRDFVLPFAENLLDSSAELCDVILGGIATGDDNMTTAPEPIHTARIAELSKAFGELSYNGLIAEAIKARRMG